MGSLLHFEASIILGKILFSFYVSLFRKRCLRVLSTNRILEIKDIKCCFSIYTQQKLELRKDDFSAHQVAAYRAELTDPEAPEYLTVSGNFLTLLRASLGSIKLISNLVCLFGARWQAEPARSPREGAGTARLQRRDRAQQGSRVGNPPGHCPAPHWEQPHARSAHCHAVCSLSAAKVTVFL